MVKTFNNSNYFYGNSPHQYSSIDVAKLISDSEDGLKQIKTLLKYLSKLSRHISNTITTVKQLLKVSIECDVVSEEKRASYSANQPTSRQTASGHSACQPPWIFMTI